MKENKRREKRKRTLEFHEIIQLYENGCETSEIAKLANVTPRYISKILSEHNVDMRPFGSWKRQYTLNEHYFKEWSNNMAYILGFILADGCISGATQTVTISQKEPGILEKIKVELGSNYPLQRNKKTGVYLLNLNSKILKEDLINIHGITQNKSLTVDFPFVPDEYLNHFVRGYFDGDGNINYQKYVVSFVGGSINLLIKLQEVLSKECISSSIMQKGNYYRLILSGRKSIQIFSNWIYQNKELYLTRKFDLFQQEELDVTKLLDRKQKHTKEAVAIRKQNFLKEYSISKSIGQSCGKIDIKESTFKRWLNKDDKFRTEFNLLS